MGFGFADRGSKPMVGSNVVIAWSSGPNSHVALSLIISAARSILTLFSLSDRRLFHCQQKSFWDSK